MSEVKPMGDLSPMLLTDLDNGQRQTAFQDYKSYIFQEKYNGVRAFIHFKDGKIVSIRNRRNVPCLHLYPELKELIFKDIGSAILDCEIVVFDKKGKSIFYGGINQRDKKLYSEAHIKAFPITAVIFDIVYLNGKNLFDLPYIERYGQLIANFNSVEHFKIVENIDEPEQYWNDKIIPEEREGLVIKNPNASYEFGIRSKEQLKLKNYKTAEVVITSVEQNPKGLKIYGQTTINGNLVFVENQFGGIFDLKVGERVPVEYLDIVGNKMIQPL
jgi:ATP-dependent DNA ligase